MPRTPPRAARPRRRRRPPALRPRGLRRSSAVRRTTAHQAATRGSTRAAPSPGARCGLPPARAPKTLCP
eukprot:338472-Alexandrium_andersonii.AAC.1